MNKINQTIAGLMAASCVAALVASSLPREAQAVNTQAIAGCAANASVDVTFAIGTRWELCWEHDQKRGLVLNQATFTPKFGTRTLVLGSAALAQVLTSPDNAVGKSFPLTGGGLKLNPLSTAECAQGSLRNDPAGQPVMCQQLLARGYAWRGTGQIQGQNLVLSGVSNNGTDTYVQRWVLADDGTLTPMLGVSGRLNPSQNSNASTGWPLGTGNTRYATNRLHTAYWRLNFDIGGNANDLVEQFDYSGTDNIRTQSVTAIAGESARTVSPETQRFWRVRDTQVTNANGHFISYQINLPRTSVHRGADAFTRNDFYVTNNKACEVFVSGNPTTGACASDVTGYINNESISDVVVWAGATWHQVSRDEDERDMPIHWISITLTPRDFVAVSPLE